jgi:hypothetical protein
VLHWHKGRSTDWNWDSETSRPEVIVENMPEYDDSNRAFLQAFMARSCMTFEDAQPILAAILTVSGTLLLLKPRFMNAGSR